jgi:transporter family protein
MESWVFYGIAASVFFAVNTIVYKVAAQKGNFSPYFGSFVFGLGIVLLFGLFFIFRPGFSFEWKSSSLALIAGVIWGLGFLAIAIAISKGGNVSQLAPIYNTNTILAVLLGIIFLKEIPDVSQVYRIIGGAVLIVAGSVLVSI